MNMRKQSLALSGIGRSGMPKEPLITKSLRLPAAVWAELEAYRVRVGAVTLADAVRRLILAGLRAERRAEK